jgi:predicted DNA-binding transcriptional regulator AlpA
MNRTELRALPAVVDVPTAAKVMGMSRTAAYELIRVGGWPTPVFRLGKLIRIPTTPLLDLLGVREPATTEQADQTHAAS